MLRMNSFVFLMAALSPSLLAGGAWAAQGLTPDKIVIGQVAGFTGPEAALVREMTNGAKAYFEQVNAQGGVGGRKIDLASMDDGGDASRTPAAVRALIDEEDIFALLLTRGTAATEAAYPILEQARVPLIGPSSGARSMHEPPRKFLFPVRAGYRSELGEIVKEFGVVGVSKVAIFHSPDAFGLEGLAEARRVLSSGNLSLAAVASHPAGGADVAAAIASIAKAAPQAVILIAGPDAAAAFIKGMKKAGANPTFVSLSNNNSNAFIANLGTDCAGVLLSQDLPYPLGTPSSRYPVIKEYQAAVKAAPGAVLSYASIEGYIAAKVLVEALRRMDPRPTRESLVTALESMQGYDMGGVVISYAPQVRTGASFAEMTIIGKNGKIFR